MKEIARKNNEFLFVRSTYPLISVEKDIKRFSNIRLFFH